MGRPTKEMLKNRPLKKPLKRLRRSNRSKSLSEMATKDPKKVELRSKNAKLDKKRKNKMEDLPSKRPRRSVTVSENNSEVLELNSNNGRTNESLKLEAKGQLISNVLLVSSILPKKPTEFSGFLP